jgi:hypothetical protein
MTAALLVFAQPAMPRVDVDAWNAHATRFFATRLGLAEVKRDGPGEPPWTEPTRLVVAPDGQAAGIRTIAARPSDERDLAMAAATETRAAGSGLALLARRCPTIWRVDRDGDDDALALRLAAILASLLLGPILDPSGPDIFGVKTARERLARAP